MSHPVTPPPFEQGGAVPPPAAPQEGAASPPPPIPGFPPEGKQKKSGMKKLLGILATILVVLVVIGIKSGVRSMFSEDPLEDAVVGSCLTDTPKAEDTEVIVCTDAKAGYTVVGKVADVSKAKFDADPDGALCSAFPSAKTSLWVEKGTFLLCLDEK